MKFHLLSSALIALVPGVASADGAFSSGTLDVSLRGGLSEVFDNEYTYSFGGPNGPGWWEYDYESSFIVGAAIGYDFEGPWRIELEVTHRGFEADRFQQSTGAVLTTIAEISEWVPMVRASYDVVRQSNFNVALGLGLGAAIVEFETLPNATPTTNSDWALTAQAFTEFRYKVNDKFSLTLEYRVDHFDGARADEPDVATTFYYEAEHWEHALLAGFRYRP